MFSISSFLIRAWYFLCAVAMLLTFILGLGERHKGTDELELVNKEKYILIDAFLSGSQGITNDGEFYYCSGALDDIQFCTLAKLDMKTGKILKRKFNVLPKEFKDMKYDHIGDLSYAEIDGKGYLFCALEHLDDKADHLVIVFDTDLNYTGKYAYMRGYTITDEMGGKLPPAERPEEGQFLCDGIPWCAADGENGKLYCSRFRGADRLYVYDLQTLEFLYELPIIGTEPLRRIQGAEVHDGYLYVNIDHSTENGKKDRIIGKINLQTGEYETAFVRPITGMIDWESEGITVFERDSDTYITIADYDRTVATYVHTYKIVK